MSCNNEKPRIVVIGAGAAGIGCATRLHQSGLFDVVLVEARDRTGGRTHTMDCTLPTQDATNKYFVDLGATWLEGCGRDAHGRLNPVMELVQRFHHNMQPPPTQHNNKRGEYLHVTDELGHTIAGHKAERLADKRFSTLLRHAHKMRDTLEDDITIEQAFSKARHKMGWKVSDAIESSPAFLNEVSSVEQYHGGRLSDMSLKHYECGGSFGGAESWVYDGYGNLFQKLLAADFSTDKILLCHMVQTIHYENAEEECPVVITASDRKNQVRKEIPCHAAVVCLPVGVLKSNAVAFNPPLPSRKLVALNGIGSALMNKVVIRFERPFWNDNTTLLEGFTVFSRTRGKLRQWFIPYPDVPLLMCINPPDYAQIAESMTEAELLGEVKQTLATAFGIALDDMPRVVFFHRTTWGADPFSMGTWSYLRCGADPSCMGVVAEPLSADAQTNRVYFAGECTSVEDFSTAHGAYISGLRAASEVIRDHGGSTSNC
jgi:monoamine oxidase